MLLHQHFVYLKITHLPREHPIKIKTGALTLGPSHITLPYTSALSQPWINSQRARTAAKVPAIIQGNILIALCKAVMPMCV